MPDPLPNRNLTTTQERALTHYRRLTEQAGEPPTVRALGEALGVKHTAAHRLIQALREKGYLSMKPVTITRPTLTAKGRRAK
jgi:Mn-dependent DtxR family transcriptional regulator